MIVVAEGVETAEQDAILKQQNCHEFQGYLFSRPVPAESISALLANPDTLSSIPAPSLAPADAAGLGVSGSSSFTEAG
jgi:predicted signal transduction protein with EAL and GGDEF domain